MSQSRQRRHENSTGRKARSVARRSKEAHYGSDGAGTGVPGWSAFLGSGAWSDTGAAWSPAQKTGARLMMNAMPAGQP